MQLCQRIGDNEYVVENFMIQLLDQMNGVKLESCGMQECIKIVSHCIVAFPVVSLSLFSGIAFFCVKICFVISVVV